MDDIDVNALQPTRRAVLAKTAVVGGSLVWAAPVVQVLSMGVADAASQDGTSNGSGGSGGDGGSGGTGGTGGDGGTGGTGGSTTVVPAHGLLVVELVTSTVTPGLTGTTTTQSVRYAYGIGTDSVPRGLYPGDQARLAGLGGVVTTETDPGWLAYKGSLTHAKVADPQAPQRVVVTLPLPKSQVVGTSTVTTASTIVRAEDYVPPVAPATEGAYGPVVVPSPAVAVSFRGY